MNENAGCKRKQQRRRRRRRRNKHTRDASASVNANANCKFQLERARSLSLSQHNSSRTREFIFHIPFMCALARSLALTLDVAAVGERNVRALSVCVFYVVIAFHDTNSNGLPLRTA